MWHQVVIILLLLRLQLPFALTSEPNCPTSPLTAKDSEQSFEVYKDEQPIPDTYTCTWTINGDKKRSTIIQLEKGASASPNQCVKVGGNQTICNADDYPLVESFAEKTEVHYPGKEGLKGVKSFPVIYFLGNPSGCGPLLLTATKSKQSVRVNKEGTTIPIDHTCDWVLTSNNHTVKVAIEGGTTQEQCIEIRTAKTNRTVLCAKKSTTFVESSESPLLIVFPGVQYGKPIPDFTWSYVLTDRGALPIPTFGLLAILIQIATYIQLN